ncbi:hypothetical protein PTKIN_Ptkin14bG0106000 [Pterospermum kingtungense]
MSKEARIPYYFPEEILLEIFYKLPVKSLGKCLCVCKAWNFLIKTPSFVSSRVSKSGTSNNTNLFLFRTNVIERGTRSVKYSLHFDDQELSKYTQLQAPFDVHHYIVGYCNGLVCLERRSRYFGFHYEFVLWNPIIKQCFGVPKPCFCSLPNKTLIGFGFDSLRDDYKILKITQKNVQDKYVEVELYSVKTNSWKILAPQKLHLYTDNYSMAFGNGVVHWIAFVRVKNKPHCWCKFFLLGFNMCHEVFKEIMLPKSLRNLDYQRGQSSMHVMPYAELSSIAVTESVYDGSISNMWVMKKYHMVETWTKMFNLVVCGMGQVPRVLGFRKNGGLIMDGFSNQRVVLHDMEGNDVNYFGICEYSYGLSYTESLVLLDHQVTDSRSENGAKNLSNSIEEKTKNLAELAAGVEATNGSSDAED